jgi:hypothetical protein
MAQGVDVGRESKVAHYLEGGMPYQQLIAEDAFTPFVRKQK